MIRFRGVAASFAITFAVCGLLVADAVSAQPPSGADATEDASSLTTDDGDESQAPAAPPQVDIEPLAQDEEISKRLIDILEATGWFVEPEVRVEEGVVFLRGRTTDPEYKDWAAQLANSTQDVVAVVNRLQVIEGSPWDLSPAWKELRRMGRAVVQGSPLFAVALVLLVLTWYAARLSVRLAKKIFERRTANELLGKVAANAVAVPVFLLGLYLVLRISGLTQMAATVVGGTGLIGLVIGIAFRDIAENFLASILISTQRPFAIGDRIEVDGWQGFVQSVTTRGTLLMTLDGNHVQIPNATIYKATIQNFTANPKIRQNFTAGIGYDDSLTAAQETALEVLREHPAVLDDPEPWVLVEQLGSSTVNLRVYFWINGDEHSHLKVRSSIIRQIKRAFQQAEISMPDDAREVIFPQAVPVRMLSDGAPADEPVSATGKPIGDEADLQSARRDEAVVSAAEGGLASEAADIQKQARESRLPDEGTNLLGEGSSAEPAASPA